MTRDPNRTFVFIAFTSAAAIALSLALAFAALSGPSRTGVLLGLAVAGLSGAMSLWLLRRAAGRPMNALLKLLATGFLVRMLLVGVALVAAIRVFGLPTALPFAVAFFALFFFLQGIELVYVHRCCPDTGRRLRGPAC